MCGKLNPEFGVPVVGFIRRQKNAFAYMIIRHLEDSKTYNANIGSS